MARGKLTGLFGVVAIDNPNKCDLVGGTAAAGMPSEPPIFIGAATLDQVVRGESGLHLAAVLENEQLHLSHLLLFCPTSWPFLQIQVPVVCEDFGGLGQCSLYFRAFDFS